MMRLFMIFVLLVSIPCVATAADGVSLGMPGFRLARAQAGWIGTFQGNGFSGSGVLRYDPRYDFSDKLSVGASVDLSVQVTDDSSRFVAIGYLANAKYMLTPEWGTQISAGAQTWTCDACGTRLATGAMVSRALSPSWATWMKDVWVQYLAVFRDPVAHQVVAGVSVEF